MGPPRELESEGARARSNHDSFNFAPICNCNTALFLFLPCYDMILMIISS